MSDLVNHMKRILREEGRCVECGVASPKHTLDCPRAGLTPSENSVASFMYGDTGATDNVNHPPHYKQGGIECIDAIEAALTADEFRGYCKGNALKYVWRERHKGQNESLKKAIWYLNRIVGA